ncbi:alpha/beta hydrolase [Synechococcus sp. CS-1329]|nr:alpha/beta hydrolase [Synechococcus sp. CS-1329]
MVHGLLDSPAVFNRLRQALGGRRQALLIPALPLRLGLTPIAEAAELLGAHIRENLGLDDPIDLLGFSIGGVIARTWIQLQGGHERTRRFISVGSPQQGTLTAQPWPGRIFKGLADLKWGSGLLETLNGNLDTLHRIECHSFYSAIDLAVLPGWRAVLPIGARTQLPVATHPQLLRDQAAIRPLAKELIRE